MSKTPVHHARKRFGQNFLVDSAIINRIIDNINPKPDDLMIEIGPGLGAITCLLLARLNQLNVIELDRDIIPKLVATCEKSVTSGKEKLVVNEIDVLKFDFAEFISQHPGDNNTGTEQKLRIVGNLPYNISTPILFHLLGFRSIIQDMHFMLQKEVVDRIVSAPGNKNYGRLSVMLQTYCTAESLFEVPPAAFEPAPKVVSAILRLQPYSRYDAQIDNFPLYEKLVRQAFSQRRKTLKNTLKGICTSEQIEQAGLSPTQRAEELAVSDFIGLYKIISRQLSISTISL